MKDLKAIVTLYLSETDRRIKMLEEFKQFGNHDLTPFNEINGYEFAHMALEGILEDMKRMEEAQHGNV